MKATLTLTGESVRVRPTDQTEGMTRRAAELALANLVKAYPKDFGAESEREQTLHELEAALEYSQSGFDRCTNLSRHGWEITDEMVEMLADDYVGRAVYEAVALWVQDEGIVPSLALGAAVRIEVRDGDGPASMVDGVVARIDAMHARYLVRVPSLGHVTMGDPSGGTLGFLLPFEVVEP